VKLVIDTENEETEPREPDLRSLTPQINVVQSTGSKPIDGLQSTRSKPIYGTRTNK